ncbi:protein of unknown function DUF34 [Aminomonas paucivorans DSM 12260]|uniref:GTP cyclohydrolase 1 type 2 homolog n=1 Tax=Aminomonas paucivorans DSM 12260 TaxID=584708 RepID=E3CY97_9BACT|nr:protein of unknown function DUF34 [Aminomonas paucivorans DSM 12260]
MNVRIDEWVRRVEASLPPSWCASWDNAGLLVARRGGELARVAVALEATPETVEAAHLRGCGLLAVHHPILFRPLRRILYPSPQADPLLAAVAGDVAIYAAHTNWDVSPEGTNVCLARKLGLENLVPLELQPGAWGLGALGSLPAPVSGMEVLRSLSRLWGVTWVRGLGGLDRPVSRVALCGGSGGDLWEEARAQGAELFLTADMGYHLQLDAVRSGLALGVLDHGEMERASMEGFARFLENRGGLPVSLLVEPQDPARFVFADRVISRGEVE